MYKHKASEEEKERIIKDFLPFIKYTAYRFSWKLPPQLTVDDLVSVGLMALLNAIERFDSGKAKLKTYAEYKIKGAMLDELRACDTVPRSVRSKMNIMKSASAELQEKLGRAPEDEEIAESMGVSLKDYYKTIQNANSSGHIRFEDLNGNMNDSEGINIIESIADPSEKSPLHMVEETEEKETLSRMIDELPKREKLILALYYWEELTMKEIGQALSLTEGRVCQLHNKAVSELKVKLKGNLADAFAR
ncbi:MAG: FliA/WhiG family RNA polymerase sigma factor [Nitrospirae bacterium]|nr:FliA/WhiG family RNA polymerase sigma factor [Nitrospirota bacterium]